MTRNKVLFLIFALSLLSIFIYNIYFINLEGFNIKYNYDVIFAGTVRNCEPYIKKTLENINECGKKFNNYYVVIYENDSNDKTRKILNENKKSNYFYIFDDGIKEHRRTVRLSNGRNKILDKVKELSCDYLIMLDMDDVNKSGKFVDSIESCFKYSNWDVLTGNQTGKYYDLWALRKQDLINYDCLREIARTNDQDKKNHIINIINNTYFDNNGLLEVDSAFGGIAIYKISSIKNCRYNGVHPDEEEKCEHVDFNECIKENGGKIFINTEFYTS
jgi:hypothetical protein